MYQAPTLDCVWGPGRIPMRVPPVPFPVKRESHSSLAIGVGTSVGQSFGDGPSIPLKDIQVSLLSSPLQHPALSLLGLHPGSVAGFVVCLCYLCHILTDVHRDVIPQKAIQVHLQASKMLTHPSDLITRGLEEDTLSQLGARAILIPALSLVSA